MSAFFESRLSDSPYVEIIWRGHVEQDYAPVCPADVRWNLLFTKHGRRVRVTAEGATSHYMLEVTQLSEKSCSDSGLKPTVWPVNCVSPNMPKIQQEGVEFLVIKFRLGVFMPYLPADDLLNCDALLPEAGGSQSFWLDGFSWQLPDFENVEAFVERLVREGVLVTDPVVHAALQAQPLGVAERTVRRRFLQATGLTPLTIHQIERAKKAAELLGQGIPILDTVYEAGYADQPHLTRSLRRFFGQTPAQIARGEPA